MRRLMYVSRATEPESWTAERLVGLGQESVRWNKPHSVVGKLFLRSHFQPLCFSASVGFLRLLPRARPKAEWVGGWLIPVRVGF